MVYFGTTFKLQEKVVTIELYGGEGKEGEGGDQLLYFNFKTGIHKGKLYQGRSSGLR